MKNFSRLILLTAPLWAAPSIPAFAQAAAEQTDSAVFGFVGRYTSVYIERSLIPVGTDYEASAAAGGGYQKFLAEPLPDLRLGVEAGAAARAGDRLTGEIWGGAVLRYDGFRLGDDWRVSPSLTFGLSAVSGSMGAEAVREASHGGDAHLLFYLAPEISVSGPGMGDNEIFFRVHHRSGAWGRLGGMGSGHNAQVIGLRHHF